MPKLVGNLVKRKLPIFGVCLGHQGIAEFFGCKLGVFKKPYHGKSSVINHNEKSIFKNIPNPFSAGRYHSIFVIKNSVPDFLEITAETKDGIVMGLQHKDLPIISVQFHPESILTLNQDYGLKIIHQAMKILLN